MTATPQQQAAIDAPVNANVVLTAVPGAGKTYVIERRISHLVNEGINPNRILVITFSRAQAEDMALRIFSTFPPLKSTALFDGLGGNSQVTTIHAMCRRLLADYYGTFSVQKLAKDWQIRSFIEKWVDKRGWLYFNKYKQENEPVGWHSIHYWIDRAKREFIPWRQKSLLEYYLEEVGKEWYLDMGACAFDFQQHMRRQGLWTFSDLLYEMERCLKEDADFQAHWQKRFTHVLVDEAQDTNPQAMRILELLNTEALFIVGDEDQSIYRFQGAAPDVNLREGFDTMFGGLRLKMTTNFRSHPTLLKRAEQLIVANYDENTQQYSKTLVAREGCEPGPDVTWTWHDTAEDEAYEIASELSHELAQDKEPGDFFIMSRTNAQMAYFELELLQRKIPFVNLGVSSFFNRKVPRIIIDYMRLAVDPKCWKAYDKIYNISSVFMIDKHGKYLPTRYLGREFNDKLNRREPVIDELTRKQHTKDARGWARWRSGAGDLIDTLRKFGQFSKEDSAGIFAQDVLQHVLEKWMSVEYPAETDGSQSAYDDLGVILEMAERFTIEQFLGYVDQLQSAAKTKPEDLVDYVLLGTIYRFKGLERDTVYVVGLSEGLLPHRFSLGELIPTDGVPLPRTSTEWDERNLAYVAITRAERECRLSGVAEWPTIKRELSPSRFVSEMGLLEGEHVIESQV